MRLLTLLVCLAASAPIAAADKDLDENTILLLSTENCRELRSAFHDSDYGAFLRDPEVQAIAGRLRTGCSNLFEFFVTKEFGASTGDTPDAESNPRARLERVLGLASDYWRAFCQELDGRASISVGIAIPPAEADGRSFSQRMDDDSRIDILAHFQGSAHFAALHARFLDLLVAERKRADPTAATAIEELSLAGVPFRGLSMTALGIEPGESVPLDGIYIGQEGKDYYIGTLRASLTEYIEASRARPGAAPRGRLGGSPSFQRNLAALGRGQLCGYLNLEPIWRLVAAYSADSAAEKAAGGEPTPAQVLESVGLSELSAIGCQESYFEDGVADRWLVALGARRGIWELFPASVADVAMPSFVTKDCVAASVVTLRFDALIPLVLRLAREIGGDEAVALIENDILEKAKAETGVDWKAQLANLSGPVVSCNLGMAPGASGPMAMAMPAMGHQIFVAARLSDPTLVRDALESFRKDLPYGALLDTETYEEQTLYRVNWLKSVSRGRPQGPPGGGEREPGTRKTGAVSDPEGEEPGDTPGDALAGVTRAIAAFEVRLLDIDLRLAALEEEMALGGGDDSALPPEYGGMDLEEETDMSIPPEYLGLLPPLTATIHDDWLIIGVTPECVTSALRAANGEPSGRLADDAEFQKLVARDAGGRFGISYNDQGRSIATFVDQFRPVLGMAPMFLRDALGIPGVVELADVRNLPSSAVITKYFGKTLIGFRITDSGLVVGTWMPRVYKEPPAAPEAKEKKL